MDRRPRQRQVGGAEFGEHRAVVAAARQAVLDRQTRLFRQGQHFFDYRPVGDVAAVDGAHDRPLAEDGVRERRALQGAVRRHERVDGDDEIRPQTLRQHLRPVEAGLLLHREREGDSVAQRLRIETAQRQEKGGAAGAVVHGPPRSERACESLERLGDGDRVPGGDPQALGDRPRRGADVHAHRLLAEGAGRVRDRRVEVVRARRHDTAEVPFRGVHLDDLPLVQGLEETADRLDVEAAVLADRGDEIPSLVHVGDEQEALRPLLRPRRHQQIPARVGLGLCPGRQERSDPIPHPLLARRHAGSLDEGLEDGETPPLARRSGGKEYAGQGGERQSDERPVSHRSPSAIALRSVARAATSCASMISPGVPG